MNADFFAEKGYSMVRRLADGRWIGLLPQIYTFALCVDLGRWGCEYHYSYEFLGDAIVAAGTWTGIDHPPGPWIVRKGQGEDLYNPSRLAEGVIQ